MADTSIEIARVDGVNAADAPPARDDAQDPVLAALHMAEDIYESECRTLERRQAALDDARRQLSLADQRQQETQARLEDAEGRLRESEKNRQQTEGRLRQTEDRLRASPEHAELERERARRLAEALRNIHRTVFGGNIYDLLLRACLTLTGATRGLYVTVRGPDQRLRIRSAIDVQGYPSAPPSEYLKALCHRVLTD